MRRHLFLSLLLCALLLRGAAAGAQTPTDAVDQAVEALQRRWIYISPDAERPSDEELASLNDAVVKAEPATGQIYIAVLPEAAGDPSQVVRALGRGLGRTGTYAVVVGRSLEVAMHDDARFSGEWSEVRDRARAEHRDGSAGELLRGFVTGIEEVATAPTSNRADDEGNGLGALVAVPLLLIGGYALHRGREQHWRRREQLEDAKREVRADLAALHDAIAGLQLRTELPDVPQEAKSEYAAAVSAHAQARAAIDAARRSSDVRLASERIEQGAFAAALAHARLPRFSHDNLPQ